jgi:acetyl-CoA carboxylase beta subunit
MAESLILAEVMMWSSMTSQPRLPITAPSGGARTQESTESLLEAAPQNVLAIRLTISSSG